MREIVEALEIHKELNPKIWDSNMNLLPDVKDKILEIVEEFKSNVKDMTGIDLNVADIHILGSNASYNYTSKSDLDVHLVVNFEMIDTNEDLVQALFNLQKSEFNDAYDISIHGIDVELYVEDIKANTISNGIYSVMTDTWIKKPEPIIDVPEVNIEDKIDEWKEKISDILEREDIDEISETIDELYLLRKNGLATTGEYGEENQLFKEIRNLDLLAELKDKYMELKSKELSLEIYKREVSMIRVLRESFEQGEYIGGELSDIYEQADFNTEEGEDAYYELIEERTETIDDYIQNFASNYIVYKPDSVHHKFELWSGDMYLDIRDMWESMAIKEGVDLIAYPKYLKAVGYYGTYEDEVYLYPISNERAAELEDILDNADFGDPIENEIAQYAYNGASIEDVLLSWAK